jgi:hypothetical protein
LQGERLSHVEGLVCKKKSEGRVLLADAAVDKSLAAQRLDIGDGERRSAPKSSAYATTHHGGAGNDHRQVGAETLLVSPFRSSRA